MNLIDIFKVIVFGAALQQTVVAGVGILKAIMIMSTNGNGKANGNFAISIVLWTIFYALTLAT